MYQNQLLDKLPPHLKQFIVPQHYENYSPIDHAVWRYVMRRNVNYLKMVAHPFYLKGLEKTGITIDSIPGIEDMNQVLNKIGWAAVTVDGFIPPNAFMEFQAYKVLVIASDIRQLQHIEYTPAPDIIHEAAGHAPLIADPDYAEYLRRIGAIGARAIVSSHDNEIYEAVRKLSILKEAGDVTDEELKEAEDELNILQNKKVELSEMALIRNIHWWTVEYGLIGDIQNPKIYGAGLLSSIGESESSLKPNIKKNPFNLEASKQSFDITKEQPQLFVTPNFAYLMEVLEEFANTLSLRKGGYKGIQRLIESNKIGTIELNTGLQISGIFTHVKVNEDNKVIFFKTSGPTSLAFHEKEMVGHGAAYHHEGFSSPIGKIKNVNIPLEEMSPVDLKAHGFYDGQYINFEFESGIKVEGLITTGIRNEMGKLLIIEFEYCTVTYNSEVLFKPEYGNFHMAVGSKVVSAFAGAADYNSFPNLYNKSATQTKKAIKSEAQISLENLYREVKDQRISGKVETQKLYDTFNTIKKTYPNDWLLCIEMIEIANEENLKQELVAYLRNLSIREKSLNKLINGGFELLNIMPN